jgi:hypothetical protein
MLPAMMPAIANFAGGLGKGLGDAIGGGGGPMVSGGGWDFRSAFDNSGWTVSTGSSKATGGARSGGGPDMTGQPQGPIGQAMAIPQQAGLGWIGLVLMVGLGVYFVARGGKL